MKSLLARAVVTLALSVAPLAVMAQESRPAAGGRTAAGLRVLSSRPDMVTGGDALLSVSASGQAAPGAVTVNGKPVAAAVRWTHAGDQWVGRVVGLPLGKSSVSVTLPGGRSESVGVV